MKTILRVDIGRDRCAPAAARRAIESLEGAVESSMVPEARLLVSELITNSVKYGNGGPVTLEVASERPDKIRVEVIDQGSGFVPAARTKRLGAASRRGPRRPVGRARGLDARVVRAERRALTEDDGQAISYKVLRRGTPVRAADGTQIGTVRRVLDNARENIFDGIVIDTRSGRRFVDAPEVARVAERAVTLTIDAAEAAALPDPGSRLAARVSMWTSARRARRLGRSMRDRWDRRG